MFTREWFTKFWHSDFVTNGVVAAIAFFIMCGALLFAYHQRLHSEERSSEQHLNYVPYRHQA